MAMPTIWTEGSKYVLIRFNDEGSLCPNYFVADDSRLNQWLSDEMAEDFIEEHGLKKMTVTEELSQAETKKRFLAQTRAGKNVIDFSQEAVE